MFLKWISLYLFFPSSVLLFLVSVNSITIFIQFLKLNILEFSFAPPFYSLGQTLSTSKHIHNPITSHLSHCCSPLPSSLAWHLSQQCCNWPLSPHSCSSFTFGLFSKEQPKWSDQLTPLFKTYPKQILKSYNTQHGLASGSPLTSSPTCSLYCSHPDFLSHLFVTAALSLSLCICLLFFFLEIPSSRNLHGLAFHFRPMLQCQSLKKPSLITLSKTALLSLSSLSPGFL